MFPCQLLRQHYLTLALDLADLSELGYYVRRFTLLFRQVALHRIVVLVKNGDRSHFIFEIRVRTSVRVALLKVDVALKLVHIFAELLELAVEF